jgi:Flp pilus assembly protein CpaB
MEHDRRNRLVIAVGLALAVLAGAGVFQVMSQAQQEAKQLEPETIAVVVAARAIPARTPIVAADLMVRQLPLAGAPAQGLVNDPVQLLGLILAVAVYEGQPVTTNLLVSANTTANFSILGPEETVGPDSEAWRAVSVSVPDERAVGGLLAPGLTVDMVATATVLVPQEVLEEGTYYVDQSSKVSYQDVIILARVGPSYVLKVTLAVAEEIAHLQAVGNVQFSLVLRPEIDVRIADASELGTTTNRFLERYGLPIPEVYPRRDEPLPTLPPLPSPTPQPTPAPTPAP